MRASTVDAAFAREWTPLVAALVRRFGDLGLAEDSAAEAFAEAARTWGDSPPERPGAWLQTVARRRAVDVLRRRDRFEARAPLLATPAHRTPSEAVAVHDDPVDDQLALVFGCCHPALSMDARVALTLRAVHGLSTAQIADAFLVGHETMTRRLHRARTKVRDGGIGFRIPAREHWPRRVDAVLRVVYVVFTAGHTATRSSALVRGDLCDEARWLAGLLCDLLPDEAEVAGLAALLDLTDARRPARVDAAGEVVLLEDQDRSLWDGSLADAGQARLREALRQRRIGPFQLQAMVAATHARAARWQDTDWEAIAEAYGLLTKLDASPVVALNHAVAVAMARGPESGLALVDELVACGRLDDYHYLWATRADLLRRLGRDAEAVRAYDRALTAVTNEAEARFLRRRREQVHH